MARLFADEGFPLPVVEGLRALGHDVQTLQDTGRANQGLPDAEVLRLSVSDERALLTVNRRDFIALHKVSAAHAGVIVCTVDPDSLGQAGRVDAAVRERPTLAGELVRINRPPT